MIESKQQLIERAKMHGRKIGYYLSVLDIHQDHRETIIQEMGELDTTGIESLIELLEIRYIHRKNGQLNDWFKKRFDSIAPQLKSTGNSSIYNILVTEYSLN